MNKIDVFLKPIYWFYFIFLMFLLFPILLYKNKELKELSEKVLKSIGNENRYHDIIKRGHYDSNGISFDLKEDLIDYKTKGIKGYAYDPKLKLLAISQKEDIVHKNNYFIDDEENLLKIKNYHGSYDNIQFYNVTKVKILSFFQNFRASANNNYNCYNLHEGHKAICQKKSTINWENDVRPKLIEFISSKYIN